MLLNDHQRVQSQPVTDELLADLTRDIPRPIGAEPLGPEERYHAVRRQLYKLKTKRARGDDKFTGWDRTWRRHNAAVRRGDRDAYKAWFSEEARQQREGGS